MSRDISAEQYEKMTQSPIPQVVTSLAIPSTIAATITVIYNTADTYFVSQLNESAAAAVGVVYSIMAILQAVGFGIGVGASSLVSRRLGEQKDEDAHIFASSAMFGTILAGLLVGVLCLSFLQPLLTLIGASETMLPYATPYATIILLGAPMTCSSFVLTILLRSEGNSKLAMWGSVTGGLLNILLDALFIFGCGWETAGAALATIISQCANWLICFSAFLRKKTILQLRLRYISHSFRVYWQLLSTGAPTILRQGLGSLSTTVLNISAGFYGNDATVAAVTISGKVYTFVRQMTIGLGQGFQPVAGYNYGAGYVKRSFSAFSFATIVGSVICCSISVLTAVFARPIMMWFSDSAEVVDIGTQALQIFSLVMPMLAFSTFVNQLYQCLGFAKTASFLASCRQGLFFLPLIGILPLFWGQLGVLLTQPLADLLTFGISIPYLFYFRNKYLTEPPAA